MFETRRAAPFVGRPASLEERDRSLPVGAGKSCCFAHRETNWLPSAHFVRLPPTVCRNYPPPPPPPPRLALPPSPASRWRTQSSAYLAARKRDNEPPIVAPPPARSTRRPTRDDISALGADGSSVAGASRGISIVMGWLVAGSPSSWLRGFLQLAFAKSKGLGAAAKWRKFDWFVLPFFREQ